MQGRPDAGGESWDKTESRRMAALNGTSKQRAIPQRPPGMTRVSKPPETPRVARPQHEASPPRSLRRRIIVLSSFFVACTLFACVGGSIGTNYINGLNASSGAAATAAGFLSLLSEQNYTQAYRSLGTAITIKLAEDDFASQAQANDRCYGPITDFAEVPESAVYQDTSQSYAYTITRSKDKKPYQLRLILTQQQGQDGSSTWKITNYGNDLGPTRSSVSCK
jgi:hypothetical protein